MTADMLPLDHLVLATPDLAATTSWFAEATGVAPTPGGQHVGFGTRNELVALGETSYLEIVGPDLAQDTPAGPRPFGIDDLDTARLVTFAVKASDLHGHVTRCSAAGVNIGAAFEMSRAKPDGSLLEWSLTIAPPTGTIQPLPFLIDWGTTPSPAVSSAQGVSLIELTAAHPDPTHLRQQLEILGVDLAVSLGDEVALSATLACPNGPITLH